MTEGWRPLKPPERPGRLPESVKVEHGTFIASPFVRLARVHALGAAGDAMVAVALAGSLFFSIDPSAARVRVAFYLLFTMAPFALVSRYIGPAIDRSKGGRRVMIITINLVRAVAALLMITNLDSLLLFPLAFAQLVCQKGYAVAKATMVPTVVRNDDELVDKNARLALLSGLAGFAGAAPAALAQFLGGPELAVAMAGVVFLIAAFGSTQLPRVVVATEAIGEVESAELRAVPIARAASTMNILRATLGFFSFLVAFAYRGGTDNTDFSGPGKRIGAELFHRLLDRSLEGGGVSAARLGIVVGAVVLGTLVAALVAARLRDLVGEDRILEGGLATAAAVALVATWVGGLSGAVVLGFVIGLAVNASKLAFDSIVQRNAPDANYGRSFGRFEARFQVAWVVGAIIPVVMPIPARLGFFIVFLVTAGVALWYRYGGRVTTARAARRPPEQRRPPARQPLGEDEPDPTVARTSDPATDPTLPFDDEPPVAQRRAARRTLPPADEDQLPLWDDHR